MKTLALLVLMACSHANAPPSAPPRSEAAPAPAAEQTTDDCEKVVDKTFPIIIETAKNTGKQVKDDDKGRMLDQCRKALAEGHRDPAMNCILAATDDASVRACFQQALGEYQSRTAATEGWAMIRRLQRGLEATFAETGGFPAGKLALTPKTPCCKQPDQRCAAVPAEWNSPAWKALNFAVEDPSRFQYRYTSDGKTVTAAAVGDMKCNGHTVTIALTAKIANGKPVIDVTEPK